MGIDDKMENQGKSMRGKAKETLGRATQDEDLQYQGRAEQAKADAKQAGEKLKDAFKH